MAFLVAGAVRLGVKAVKQGVAAHRDAQDLDAASERPVEYDRWGNEKKRGGPVYDLVMKVEGKGKGRAEGGAGTSPAVSQSSIVSERVLIRLRIMVMQMQWRVLTGRTICRNDEAAQTRRSRNQAVEKTTDRKTGTRSVRSVSPHPDPCSRSESAHSDRLLTFRGKRPHRPRTSKPSPLRSTSHDQASAPFRLTSHTPRIHHSPGPVSSPLNPTIPDRNRRPRAARRARACRMKGTNRSTRD